VRRPGSTTPRLVNTRKDDCGGPGRWQSARHMLPGETRPGGLEPADLQKRSAIAGAPRELLIGIWSRAVSRSTPHGADEPWSK
jgi:hypothetical protein